MKLFPLRYLTFLASVSLLFLGVVFAGQGHASSTSSPRAAVLSSCNPHDPSNFGIAVYPKLGASLATRVLTERSVHTAHTNWSGWPVDQCEKMDKGTAGQNHTIIGVSGIHSWLLGGYGNDTIVGGDSGDVIWADYQASGWPSYQTATIRAGNGRNVIYANDTMNHVWTGTNPGTVVHAYQGKGEVHCQNPKVIVYMSHASRHTFKLFGCSRISYFSWGY